MIIKLWYLTFWVVKLNRIWFKVYQHISWLKMRNSCFKTENHIIVATTYRHRKWSFLTAVSFLFSLFQERAGIFSHQRCLSFNIKKKYKVNSIAKKMEELCTYNIWTSSCFAVDFPRTRGFGRNRPELLIPFLYFSMNEKNDISLV